MTKSGRILFLQGTSEIGGSDISLLRIIEALDRSRFEPMAMLPAEGPLVAKLKALGCPVFIEPHMLKATTRKGVFYFFRYFLNYPIAAWKIVQVIKREKVDILHTNTLHNFYGYMASRVAGCAHIMHIREIVMHAKWLRSFELALAKMFSDRILVTSEAIASMFSKDPQRRPKHLVKIPNSIDTDQYQPQNDPTAIYQDLNLSDRTPLVGLVCRLDHWKGVDVFIKAASICHAKNPTIRFLVAGGPIEGREDYAAQMYQLARDLKLEDIVIFTDWKYGPQEMPKVHAALDLLVLASTWPEPFGLVLLEAMATGKPIVATNHGGPTEICKDGETALLVKPSDPGAMAEAMMTIMNDPIRAKRMGEAGRKRVVSHFDRKVCIQKLEDLYTELLSR